MRLRTPLIVAVVGALLVGGATTGTTAARWRDQAVLSSSTVRSGAMSHTVLNGNGSSLGTLSMAAGASTAAHVEATVSDTSSAGAVNLRQQIEVSSVALSGASNGLTLSHLLLSVTRKSGSCPTTATTPAAGYTSAGLDTTAPGGTFDVCVAVAATSSAPASTGGTLTLTFQGRQVRPGGSTPMGWTADAKATVGVTVTPDAVPSAPIVSCSGSGTNPSLTWTATAGATSYRIYRSATPLVLLRTIAAPATSASMVETDMGAPVNSNQKYDVLVKAVNAAGESTSSNVFRIQFKPNGACSG